MKYVATNGEVYIQARSLGRLSRKVEKYLVKTAKIELKRELDVSRLEEYYALYQISYFDYQVNIKKLGIQRVTVKGMYIFNEEIAMWNITRWFKVSKRW